MHRLQHRARVRHSSGTWRTGLVLAMVLALCSASVALAAAPGTWRLTGSMAIARRGHTATLLPDGRVLVAGGGQLYALGTLDRPLASAELYDPVRGTWTVTGSLNQAREGHTATLLLDGLVLAAGGLGSPVPYPELPPTLTSAALYTPPTAEVLPSSCVLAGSGLTVAGQAEITVAARDLASGLQSVQVLQASNASVALPSFPSGSRDPAVVTATKLDPT